MGGSILQGGKVKDIIKTVYNPYIKQSFVQSFVRSFMRDFRRSFVQSFCRAPCRSPPELRSIELSQRSKRRAGGVGVSVQRWCLLRGSAVQR